MTSLTTYDLNRVADDVDAMSENALNESGSEGESDSESGSGSGSEEEDRPIRLPAIPTGTSRTMMWPGKGKRQVEEEEEVVSTQIVCAAGGGSGSSSSPPPSRLLPRLRSRWHAPPRHFRCPRR